MLFTTTAASAEWGNTKLKGRIFVMSLFQQKETTVIGSSGLEQKTIHTHDLLVDSARLGIKFESPLPWLSGEVEAELTGRADLKDAYVSAEGKRLRLKVGQHKMSTSAIYMESAWDLPSANRGLINTLLDDWLDVGGRRPGVTFELRGKKPFKPRLQLGVFQGSRLEDVAAGDRSTDLIEGVSLDAQSYVARTQAEFGPLTLGGFYEHRIGAETVLEHDHYWTAGGDLTFAYEHPAGAIRAWADGIFGESWYEHADKAVDGETAVFASARLIIAARWGGLNRDEAYLEPYTTLSWFDPDMDVRADAVVEGAQGLNLGYWDRVRLGLEVRANNFGRNVPGGYFLGQPPARLTGMIFVGGVI